MSTLEVVVESLFIWIALWLLLVLVVSVVESIRDLFKRYLPHVGEVWEDRKTAHPWVRRDRVEITDVREGWLKYKTIDPQRWSYNPQAVKISSFVSLFRKSKDQTKPRCYHIGVDIGIGDMTAVSIIDRMTPMPGARFDFTIPKQSKKMLKKIKQGKFYGYSMGSKKAGKK